MKTSNKLKAITKFLIQENININELRDSKYGFEVGNKEFLVLTDKEANEKAKEYILESVWAFRTWFLENHIPEKYYDIIPVLQEKCENGNEGLLGLIKNKTKFVNDAINTDSRGHFISSYDGVEHEINVDKTTYYIYRTN